MIAVTVGIFPRSDPAPLNSELLTEDGLATDTNELDRPGTFWYDVVGFFITC
jgi:hypothetical protein